MQRSATTLISVKEAAELLGLGAAAIRTGTQGTASLTRVCQGKRIFLIREEVQAHSALRKREPEGKDEG
jgi:hypothetical protein